MREVAAERVKFCRFQYIPAVEQPSAALRTEHRIFSAVFAPKSGSCCAVCSVVISAALPAVVDCGRRRLVDQPQRR